MGNKKNEARIKRIKQLVRLAAEGPVAKRIIEESLRGPLPEDRPTNLSVGIAM